MLCMKKDERTFYEVIRSDRACKLHFDLEIYTKNNEHINGDNVLQNFVQFVKTKLSMVLKVLVYKLSLPLIH